MNSLILYLIEKIKDAIHVAWIIIEMKKVGFVVLAALLLFACKKEDNNKVEFRALSFSSIVSDTLKIDSVHMSTFFSNPTSLFVIDDSLLLVFDDDRSDKLCHFIHTKGSVVKSFGERGRTRGEFIFPQGLSLSKDKKTCCVYDYNTQCNVCFSVEEALGGGNPVQDVIRMEDVESEQPVEHRFYQVLALSDNRFLGFGNHPENRIQVFNKSKMLATYSDFPVLDEIEENNRSIWSNLASFGVSPDEKHVVITTGIGAAFEILSLNGEKISHRLVKGFYAPKYSIAQGAVPVCVIVCPETVVGFNALHVANDCFYAVLAGPEERYNEILQFNFNGECVHRYCLPSDIVYINCMTVDEGRLWAFVENKDGEIKLIKARI